MAFYLMECVFWLREDQRGFTRSSKRAWRKNSVTPLSFTLLGRRPLVVDPLFLRPGFVRTGASVGKDEDRALRRVAHRLDRLWFLLDLCRLQALTLLVYLPAIMFLHRLELLWRFELGLVGATHAAISALAICELRRVKKRGMMTAAVSLICNPLGTTRAMEILSQALFERYLELQDAAKTTAIP